MVTEGDIARNVSFGIEAGNHLPPFNKGLQHIARQTLLIRLDSGIHHQFIAAAAVGSVIPFDPKAKVRIGLLDATAVSRLVPLVVSAWRYSWL